MSFECLIGLIGVKAGEVTPEPSSGLYVTSLPDITLSELSKINDSDQTDWKKLWSDVESRSILKFRTLFLSEINRCHRISDKDVAETLICENKELLSVALWYLLGAELMWERINSSRLNRYTTIDRARAKDLRGEFMNLFQSELEVAVAGIDLSAIEEVEERNIITSHIPII